MPEENNQTRCYICGTTDGHFNLLFQPQGAQGYFLCDYHYKNTNKIGLMDELQKRHQETEIAFGELSDDQSHVTEPQPEPEAIEPAEEPTPEEVASAEAAAADVDAKIEELRGDIE